MISTSALAGPRVWIADEGERVTPTTEPRTPGSIHRDDPLFALRGETLALQIAIRSEELPLGPITVDVESEPGLSFSRFVVLSTVSPSLTRNGYSNDDKTLGWAAIEARPQAPPLALPDTLIPLSSARRLALYPLRIPAFTTAIIWLDVFVPEDAEPGGHRAAIRVVNDGKILRRLSLNIDVKAATLPFRAVDTAIFYDPDTLRKRFGDPRAELELWRLLHSHHLTPMLSADDADEIPRFGPALDGSAYLHDDGYLGPGQGVGDDLVVFGAYGSLGEPSERGLNRIADMQRSLERFQKAPLSFLYAIDEQCESPRASRWRHALRNSGDAALAAIRVGETCHLRPPARAADLVMVPSASFRRDEADEARAAGQWLWVYNGQRPRSGPLMVDVPPLDLRANGWIASTFDIDRWFYWEAIFWNDINAGGWGSVDPFATTDTFHNSEGDAALGDGLLVYPRNHLDVGDVRAEGVLLYPSIRLKSLRRGIQDAGYVALVASQRVDLAERVVRRVIPKALDELPTVHQPATWPSDPLLFFEARRALWDAIPPGLALEREAVGPALSVVASLRQTHVDTSPEDPSDRSAIAMLFAVAMCAVVRRAGARPSLSRTTSQGPKGDPANETKAFRQASTDTD